MKNIILFDDAHYSEFLPLVYTRPIGDLRVGISKIQEKWSHLGNSVSFYSNDYLMQKFPLDWNEDNYMINSRYLPNDYLWSELDSLANDDSLWNGEDLVAARIMNDNTGESQWKDFHTKLNGSKRMLDNSLLLYLTQVWDLFQKNGAVLHLDFNRLTKAKESQKIPNNVQLIGSKDQVFIEVGAKLNYVTLNAETGPIYLGKDSEVMEGSVIRGPFALLDGAGVKLAAKIYGPTTIGPYSKVGGELNNVVIQGYSNKGHDGFLGNAVVGEWCNLGADTNNSNLKNNYASVKTWSYSKGGFKDTGLQFCGLAMGDHSKTGINTMLNTGTVIGVGCNVYGAGFPRTFIPSFIWGGAEGRMVHKLSKFFETAKIVMARRGIELSDLDKVILSHIFEETEKYR